MSDKRKMLKRSDRDAVIVLVVIIVICAAVFPFIDSLLGHDEQSLSPKELLDEKQKADRKKKQQQYYAVPTAESELFTFDPNTADSTQLLRLGLQPWQVRNIYKYRAAGGRYRKPSDFARLYGLTAEQYRKLLPYISIQPEQMAADVYGEDPSSTQPSTSSAATQVKRDTLLFPNKLKAGETVNINTADTTLLKRIPGIGSYFAKRIVAHRQRLGGLHSPSQLLEIDGFPESSLAYMTVGAATASDGSAKSTPATVSRIRINRLTARELSRHPYIRYAQAKQIEEYRRVRGNFTAAAQLNALPTFTQDDIEKLTPYLDFE